MLTYTLLRNLFGDLSQNSASSNLTLGDTLINQSIRKILSSWRWYFLEKSATESTVASTQFYQLPADYKKLISIIVTISSTIYTPIEITNRKEWDRINSNTSTTSNTPQYYFIFNGQLGFYPTPSSATSNAITFYYERKSKDLNIADYTTGTIITATNGSTAIVGSGTSFNASMAGRYLRITASDAANVGDGQWYEISSVTNTTNLVLVREYQGTNISTGSSNYTIGQCSIIPEDYQILSVYKALEIYYTSIQPELNQATLYKELYTETFAEMIKEHNNKTTDPVVTESLEPIRIINPNLTIEL